MGPIIATELSLAGGTATINFALANPILATELGVFAVGMAVNITMSGDISEYVSSWESVQDVVVLLQIVVTHAPPAPREPSKCRVELRTKRDGDRLSGKVVAISADVESKPSAKRPLADREVEALDWARRLAEATPEELRDPRTLAKEKAEYAARQKDIEETYEKIMSGEVETPVGYTKERLRLAVEGDPRTGERIPLTFPDEPTYREFQGELRAVFESEGITDAVVQQVGSATKGFKGNPKKPFAPWSRESDADFAVFSAQALVQAMDVDAPANKKVTMDGRYTVLKNDVDHGRGFNDTSLGEKLSNLAARWRPRLWPNQPRAEGMDFKLNLTTTPFSGAITVLDMGGGR